MPLTRPLSLAKSGKICEAFGQNQPGQEPP